jgi:hypothetical protein
MKMYRGVVVHLHHSWWRGAVSFTQQPQYPSNLRLGRLQRQSGHCWVENPACRPSLYQLSYPSLPWKGRIGWCGIRLNSSESGHNTVFITFPYLKPPAFQYWWEVNFLFLRALHSLQQVTVHILFVWKEETGTWEKLWLGSSTCVFLTTTL